ncbi:MAG: MraY family glycosyltransferase [Planctomycetota bacterium]
MLAIIPGDGSSIIAKLNYPQIGLLVVAWFAVDLLTPVVIRVCHGIGAVDRPQGHKSHSRPTPFLGGLCIFIGFSIAIFSILRFTNFEANAPLFSIILGGFLLQVIGIIDDFRPVWAVAKLGVLFVVTLLLCRFGVQIRLVGIPAVDVALTLLWIVGLTSAINSLDNMDGAATGVCAIAAFWTFYIGWYWQPFGQPGVTYVAIALFGASLGFLRYNFKPAKIFLGDNGSLLLGFLLASLMVLTGWARGDLLKSLIVPCAVLSVPLYDITLSTILRIKNGVVRNPIQAIVYCGRDHLSHRLVALGLSQREAVMMLYLFGMVSGAVAAIIWKPEVPQRVYLPVTLVSVAMLIALGVLLDRAKVYEEKGAEPAPAPSGDRVPAADR